MFFLFFFYIYPYVVDAAIISFSARRPFIVVKQCEHNLDSQALKANLSCLHLLIHLFFLNTTLVQQLNILHFWSSFDGMHVVSFVPIRVYTFRLDDHLVTAHHFRKEEFICELCSKRFSHRPLLLKHRALAHNEVRKYPCENCTKVSLT